jgi:tetratricopeptide (TPR) repeat protein
MGNWRKSDERNKVDGEKSKLRTAFFAVIGTLALLCLGLGFLLQNLLTDRYLAEVEWKENTATITPKGMPETIQLHDELAKTERLLQMVQHEPPADVKDDVREWLDKLEYVAEEYEARGWWEQAAILLKRAVEIDKSYIHEPSSDLSRRLVHGSAYSYLKSKEYLLAQEQFQKLIGMQSISRERGLPLATSYTYLGDCFYFQHNWQKAFEAYTSALKILEKDESRSDIFATDEPIKDQQTLLLVSRLADCERNLAETNKDFYFQAAKAYHLCADSWQLQDAKDPQNYAVSLYHLAQIVDKLTPDQMETIQKKDDPNWIKHSGQYYTTGDLYGAAVSAMQNAPVEKPEVLKPMLHTYADYLYSKFDIFDALKTSAESMLLPKS